MISKTSVVSLMTLKRHTDDNSAKKSFCTNYLWQTKRKLSYNCHDYTEAYVVPLPQATLCWLTLK